jgi:hypothetical protein
VTIVTEDERGAAEYAADIEAARDRLIASATPTTTAPTSRPP